MNISNNKLSKKMIYIYNLIILLLLLYFILKNIKKLINNFLILYIKRLKILYFKIMKKIELLELKFLIFYLIFMS